MFISLNILEIIPTSRLLQNNGGNLVKLNEILLKMSMTFCFGSNKNAMFLDYKKMSIFRFKN